MRPAGSVYKSWKGGGSERCPICRKKMRLTRTAKHIRARHPIAGPRWVKRTAEKINAAMKAIWAKLATGEL